MRGSIRERRPGAFELRIYRGRDVDGKPVMLTETVRGTRRQAEARAAALVLEAEAERGDDATRRRFGALTLADLITEFLAAAEHELAPDTVRGYRSKLRRHAEPGLGATRDVRLIETRDVNKLYRDLLAAGQTPANVRKAHVALASCFNYAVDAGYVHHSPVKGARKPKVTTPAPKVPPVAIATVALEAARRLGPDHELLVRLGLATGARRGELAGLTFADIDEDRAAVYVERSATRTLDGTLTTKATKTHAKGWVGVDAGTVELVHRQRLRLAERALAAGVPLAPDAPLITFDPRCQRPASPDWFTHAWHEIRRDACGALDGVQLKHLRHCSATWLLDQGLTMREVQLRLRHDRLTTTEAFYLARRLLVDDGAADALTAIFAQADAADLG